jgi:hypothetical protein
MSEEIMHRPHKPLHLPASGCRGSYAVRYDRGHSNLRTRSARKRQAFMYLRSHCMGRAWCSTLRIWCHFRPTGKRETLFDTNLAAMHAPPQRLCLGWGTEGGQAHSVGLHFSRMHLLTVGS